MSFVVKAMAALTRLNAGKQNERESDLYAVAVFENGSGVMFSGPIQYVEHRWSNPADAENLFDKITAPTKEEVLAIVDSWRAIENQMPRVVTELSALRRYIESTGAEADAQD